jgi:hypothetical protein
MARAAAAEPCAIARGPPPCCASAAPISDLSALTVLLRLRGSPARDRTAHRATAHERASSSIEAGLAISCRICKRARMHERLIATIG